jgi:hypothetical protein
VIGASEGGAVCGGRVGMASSRWRPNSRTKFWETDRTTAPTNFCWATTLTELGVPRRTRTGHNIGPTSEILRKPGEPPSILYLRRHDGPLTNQSQGKQMRHAPWAPCSAAPREDGGGGGNGEVGVSCEQRCRGCRPSKTCPLLSIKEERQQGTNETNARGPHRVLGPGTAPSVAASIDRSIGSWRSRPVREP